MLGKCREQMDHQLVRIYRAPLVIRWPGVIRPGTVKNQMFAALDWLPTLVDIAGGPKDEALKKQIEAGQYPGIVKTTLDGLDQRDYLEGKSENSARDFFFYYSGSTPSAVRIKNWKIYYTMSQPRGAGWIEPLKTYHFPLIQNIKRDPFEQFVTPDDESLLSFGGALAAPSTAFMYSGLGIMPLGQQLWFKELESYVTYPPFTGSLNLQSHSGAGSGQKNAREPSGRLAARTLEKRTPHREASVPLLRVRKVRCWQILLQKPCFSPRRRGQAAWATLRD